MITAYYNYPNARITLHKDQSCSSIQAQHKEGQRFYKITLETLSTSLREIKTLKFASTAEINDMWVSVDCHDSLFEEAIFHYIHRQLAENYKRFADAHIQEHC